MESVLLFPTALKKLEILPSPGLHLFNLFIYLCVCLFVHVCGGAGVPHCRYGGHRTTLWSHFSTSTFMWMPWVQFRLPILRKGLCLLSHLTDLFLVFWKVLTLVPKASLQFPYVIQASPEFICSPVALGCPGLGLQAWFTMLGSIILKSAPVYIMCPQTGYVEAAVKLMLPRGHFIFPCVVSPALLWIIKIYCPHPAHLSSSPQHNFCLNKLSRQGRNPQTGNEGN